MYIRTLKWLPAKQLFHRKLFFKVNTFLDRLNGSQIGLTALGMFVVNKPMILTVRQTRILGDSDVNVHFLV